MAANFKMGINRKKTNLHISLQGDFDGTSACELIRAVKDHCKGIHRVCIHTRGLKSVYPFGRDLFRNSLYILNGKPIRLEFYGPYGDQIAPERNKFC